MNVYVTRSSVAAGDDADAPHGKLFSFPAETSVEGAIERIVESGYLASITGGKATWSAVSGFPIAVVAQQWEQSRPVGWQPVESSSVQRKSDVIHLHFNYHAQLDPETVLEVLKRLKLSAL